MRIAAFAAAAVLALAACATPPERHDIACPDAVGTGTYRLPSGAVMEFAPRQGAPGVCDVILLDGPRLDIPSGTVVGELLRADGALRGDLILRIDPRKAGGRKGRVTFAAEFSPDGRRVTLNHYREGVRVELLRLIPYLFRVGIERRDGRPSGLDVAERIGPRPGYVSL